MKNTNLIKSILFYGSLLVILLYVILPTSIAEIQKHLWKSAAEGLLFSTVLSLLIINIQTALPSQQKQLYLLLELCWHVLLSVSWMFAIYVFYLEILGKTLLKFMPVESFMALLGMIYSIRMLIHFHKLIRKIKQNKI